MLKKGMLLLALVFMVLLLRWYFTSLSILDSATVVESSQQGLVEQPCWFIPEEDWPAVNCYRMFVPENHQHPDRLISFPVIRYHHFAESSSKPPLLHLGAGGPGAAMWLHHSDVVDFIWRDFEHSVLRQGRDLYVIDPRGTGMAKPRFNCPEVTRLAFHQLKDPQPLAEFNAAETQLYLACIQSLQQQGVEVAAYHSWSVIQDLNLLQHALTIPQWSLFGVSYGAVYAQLYAKEYEKQVETLILDSPAFPSLRNMNDPVARFLRPLQQLDNYCEIAKTCAATSGGLKARLLQLIDSFDTEPIQLYLPSGFLGSPVPLKLTGDTFLAILLNAIYGDEIYHDIEKIVSELENRDITTFYYYVDSYVEMIKDQNYSGISMISHLCYDEIPFVDLPKLKTALQQGLSAHLYESAYYNYTWPADLCQVFGDHIPNPRLNQQLYTDIPTLFLLGELDTITPLEDTLLQRQYFSQSQLRTYPLAHSVHGSLDCVDLDLAAFLASPLTTHKAAECTLHAED